MDHKQRINYPQLSAPAYQSLFAVENYLKKSSIELSLLHLIKLRASQINGCAFCVDMHTKESKIHGERDLRLFHLTVWRESPLFTERERAALEWTELVTTLGHEGINDGQFEKARTFFSEQELSDLTMAIAIINTWNRLSIAFRAVPGSLDQMLGLEKAGLS